MGKSNPTSPSLDPQLLDPLLTIVGPIADRFDEAGHRLYLVGGIVRDLLLATDRVANGEEANMSESHDVDLTTDADPATIKRLASPGADAIWTQGERFGTIGVRVNDHDLEITTHRAESYDESSRKPVVTFGHDLSEDLSRRDFTINAIAIDAQDASLVDPFDGHVDLKARVLRTPLGPEVSFDDDPLRILRAARFIARFNLSASGDLVAAATKLADRLRIVSVERQAVELERLIELADPSPGFDFLQTTGVITELASELQTLGPAAVALACQLASVPKPSGPIEAGVVRRVGFLWPSRSVQLLERLKYSNADQKKTEGILNALAQALTLNAEQSFGPASARRITAAIGVEALPAMHHAAAAIAAHDEAVDPQAATEIQAVFDELVSKEDLADLGSPLSGSQIMTELGIAPGPAVGRAERFLREWRLDNGPISDAEAKELLRSEFG